MSTKNNQEEKLQSIVDDIEMDFAAYGNGISFSDFYDAWQKARTVDISEDKLGDTMCCVCIRSIEDKQAIEYKRTESSTNPTDVCYYFHPECLHALVIKRIGGTSK